MPASFNHNICKFCNILATISFILNFCGAYNQDFFENRVKRPSFSGFRYSEYPQDSRFINIFTNDPDIKGVEDTYYSYDYPEDDPLTVDRKDALHFSNMEDVFAHPPRDSLESDFGEFDQSYGESSVVNYYTKPSEFSHKKPLVFNDGFDIDKNYHFLQSQIVPEKFDSEHDSENEKYSYNLNYKKKRNVSDSNDVKLAVTTEETTKFSYAQKITKNPETSPYSNNLETWNKYEEIPIQVVSKNLKSNQNFTSSTRSKIAEVLRHYLIKLYNKKYLNTGEDIKDPEHKYSLHEDIEENRKYSNNFKTSTLKPKIPKMDDSESKLLTGDTLWYLKNKTLSKINKFLSIFTVVKFNNTECNATTLYGTWQGFCYTPEECAYMGGMSFSPCAGGYGICCVFRGTCGDWSSRNCTYFKSPNYPDYYPPGGGVIVPTTTTSTPTPGTPDPRLHWYYSSETLKDSSKKPLDYFSFDTRYETHDLVSKTLKNAENGLEDELLSRQSTTSDTFSCIYSVYKNNPNIKQMRIDFIDLDLATPTNGTCQQERLVITGQNSNDPVPVICGYNTGQHIYVDVSQLNGPLQLTVLSTSGARKRFKMKICQYDDSCLLPVNNCLQYYTGVTGVIQSFNYDQASMFNRSSPGYFNNLNYAICIRREAGYCSVTYTNVQNGITYLFQLVNLDNSGRPTVPAGQSGVDIFNCPDDYIVIDGTRLCGNRFNDGSTIRNLSINAAVTDTSAGPIVVSVRTDSDTTGLGFKLFYTQNLCGTSNGNTVINMNIPNPRS